VVLRVRLSGKNLETVTSDLHLLQDLEISQNRQSFLCKSLEKTSRNLEMFGKSWEQFIRAGPTFGGLNP
jgi:hypothetical protein